MLVLLFFAFLSGLVTILAPCIWPLLPIVLSSSVAGNGGHRRPLGITLGIMLSFTIFTLSISYLVKFFHLDPNILRIVAVVIIAVLGFMMIIPGFGTILELAISRLTSRFSNTSGVQGSGFGAGFIAGMSLGLVWSPCAGPILASIAALAATGQVSFQIILVTFAYVSGVGIPLFIIALAGQKFISQSRNLSPYLGRIQQIFGVVMILTAILIYTNKVQDFQLALVNKFPIVNRVFNGLESSGVVTNELDKLTGKTQQTQNSELFNVVPQPAPEFIGITSWLNTSAGSVQTSHQGNKPLTMKELKGKVVLVDFWTYTCINCIRTLPYVTSWYEKYHDKGFVVVGVHTPEFAFEKETNNVLDAMKRFSIHYPVAQDNNYATWNAYSNQYWPAEYLIDSKGMVRRVHFGEGEYDHMEKAIQALLSETGQKVDNKISEVSDQTPQGQLSPETYLGSKRMQYLVGEGSTHTGVQVFPTLNKIEANRFAFAGKWNVMEEYSTSGEDAAISYNFYAGKVFLVMRPGIVQNTESKIQNMSKVNVLLDGKVIESAQAGSDVKKGLVTAEADRLYELVNLHGKTEQHVLTLQFQTPGTEVFAFTFGN